MLEFDIEKGIVEIDESGKIHGMSSTADTCVKGAQAEIEVAADMMKHGFAVYRNLSPVGPVDMVAISGNGKGKVYKVQATAGRVGVRGGHYFDSHHQVPNWNILAVRHQNRVTYFDRHGNELTITKGKNVAYRAGAVRPVRAVSSVQKNIALVSLSLSARQRIHRSESGPRWVPHPTQKGVWVRPWDPSLPDPPCPLTETSSSTVPDGVPSTL
ncbi:MAG: hypothetical protein M1305_00640 [Candidatus Marsarchaeota archaeon]|nr:hypothetical protein [Candidatus Marsarchaeota archaeon]